MIPIWTIALASQVQDQRVTLPRRLVYVVNRRTVVDQATSVVEQIRQRLLAPDDPDWSEHQAALRMLAGTLQEVGSTDEQGLVLAVSTLRGELADNEQWKADPARPAIIIGTIDMIGSKLLFSGYGDGRYWRPQHAGLIGQDSLIVHDEAHLTPAFSDLLHHLAENQSQAGEPRPVRMMELSATSRGGAGPTLRLEPEDEKDQVVRDRLDAKKRLCIHQVAKDNVIRKLAELCKEHERQPARVLIYLRSPEDASGVVERLRKLLSDGGKGRVALLTGTIRGHERDELVRKNPVYRAFLDHDAPLDMTLYLVSTSAGEVGVDLDADHVVCDMTTLDSMIQRLGRVNRRGGQERKARVDVVVQTKGQEAKGKSSELEEAVQATQAILGDWLSKSGETIDVSPRALRALLDGLEDEPREKAFAPKPAAPPITDVLLDAWSLSTISKHMPGRPEVAPYLHGLTNDPLETYVVWRKEVTLLHEAKVDHDMLGDWFQACRIEAGERLRDRTDRVKKTLEALLSGHRETDHGNDFPVALLNERGEAEWQDLSRIVQKSFNLAFRTVVLPVEAGGLNEHGTLDAGALEAASDVAEPTESKAQAPHRERWLLIRDADGERYERLLTQEAVPPLPSQWKERGRVTLQQPSEAGDEQDVGRYLLLVVSPKQPALEHAETASEQQTLSEHDQRIAEAMDRMTRALGLKSEFRDALLIAAKWHDPGKARPVWQRYARNSDPRVPLAKSTRYLDGRALGGYRHEFGSLLAAAEEAEVRTHREADLILHLIAAHHGWARPHFERNAWDNTRTTAENEDGAAEVIRRFGRLQQRFGRWGLAWLEALVRCADIAASRPDAHLPAAASCGEGG